MVKQHMDSVAEIARSHNAREEENARMRQTAAARKAAGTFLDAAERGHPSGGSTRSKGKNGSSGRASGIGARLLQGLRSSGSMKTTAVRPPTPAL